jgi:ornithine decarboxylase
MPKFILTKSKVFEQYNKLKDLGLKVSYSLKTNREVGNILEETDCNFSIHILDEVKLIKNKELIWFFLQATNEEQLKELFELGVKNFVVDNEKDLEILLKTTDRKINLLLRMKIKEHSIHTGKYFVYGLSSKKVNEIVKEIKNNEFISKLGIHLHRKTQNTSEWRIKDELVDSLDKETIGNLDIINLGGGLPAEYISYTSKVLPEIFNKLKETIEVFKNKEIYIEPGRFICAPAIKLETEIIQIYDNNVIIDVSIYNCALDTVITHTKLLVEGEGMGKDYLIKGNSPTRDDIFRYRVKLENPKIGDKLIFLNAGAYNYTTDFCGFVKLETEIK